MRRNANNIRKELYEGIMEKIGRRLKRTINKISDEIVETEPVEVEDNNITIITYDGRMIPIDNWLDNARSGKIPCFIKIGDIMIKIDEDYTKMYTYVDAKRYTDNDYMTLGKLNMTYRAYMPTYEDMKVISDNIEEINDILARFGYDELPDIAMRGDTYRLNGLKESWWIKDQDNHPRVFNTYHKEYVSNRGYMAHVIPIFRFL